MQIDLLETKAQESKLKWKYDKRLPYTAMVLKINGRATGRWKDWVKKDTENRVCYIW